MNTKIKNKNGEIFYYEEYDFYETIPEMVDKNKNNIEYLKAIAPEDLRPLILQNERNITVNSNDIADTQIKVNDLENQVIDIDNKINDIESKLNWENITFWHNNTYITLDEKVSLFSKISIVGVVGFNELSQKAQTSLNLNLDIDEITSMSYHNCATVPINLLFRAGFNKDAHNISFHSYNLKNGDEDTPQILDTTELKIKGIRK